MSVVDSQGHCSKPPSANGERLTGTSDERSQPEAMVTTAEHENRSVEASWSMRASYGGFISN